MTAKQEMDKHDTKRHANADREKPMSYQSYKRTISN